MAGSELDGLDGADPEMFNGAVWVLTPTEDADDVTLAEVSGVVRVLGAEVLALTPERHDQVVAVVSHVPHLAAATLMQLATDRAEEHGALLRLAAGGFRDMTRIASGHPAIWLDICAQNRPAIVAALDGLIGRLGEIRTIVDGDDREQLETTLMAAREARANLPGRVVHPEELVEFRIRIPDRTGAAAEVFTLAADLGVNIANFEVVHLAEGNRGVAVVLVDAALPVEIAGPARGGSVEVPGDISSQYITALMLIGPLLPEGVEIHLTSPLVSRPYVDMTAAVMREFGAHEVDIEPKRIAVRPGGYVATDYHVEPDASSASYPLALVALAGGRVRVPALTRDSLQGDVRFAELLGAMGCDVTWEPDGVSVSRPADRVLEGVDVDMADVSDLVPSLAVVAVIAGSPTRIRGVGFIRSKESDRLGDLAAELSTMGADIEVEPDGLLIRPAARPLHGTRLGTHHDHRLAMAFGVLGTVVPGVVVEEAGVVSKSWPGFWDALEHIVATG
jgi:3-phosphoshikimate 1-carboxyvinyltransferase